MRLIIDLLIGLTDGLSAAKEKISKLQSQQNECEDTLRDTNVTMRALLAGHHQLISGVRSVLKTMAKVYT